MRGYSTNGMVIENHNEDHYCMGSFPESDAINENLLQGKH